MELEFIKDIKCSDKDIKNNIDLILKSSKERCLHITEIDYLIKYIIKYRRDGNHPEPENPNCAISDVGIPLPSDEEIREPIQNALYSTDRLTTDQCTELADGILIHLKESGFAIIRQ